jgi:hypothetical protein
MKNCLEATSRVAEVHTSLKDRLQNQLQIRIKDWRNENYKKQIVSGCREAKEFEVDFLKVNVYTLKTKWIVIKYNSFLRLNGLLLRRNHS